MCCFGCGQTSLLKGHIEANMISECEQICFDLLLHWEGKKKQNTHTHTHAESLIIMDVDLLILLRHDLQEATFHATLGLLFTPLFSIFRPLRLQRLFNLFGHLDDKIQAPGNGLWRQSREVQPLGTENCFCNTLQCQFECDCLAPFPLLAMGRQNSPILIIGWSGQNLL